jgi:ZIP family zinc transporter
MISTTIILLSIATFISTLLGGLFAIKFKDKLHYIMAFAAGVLLGVVAFDIFPEIIKEVNANNFNSTWVMIALVTGFLLFHILEKSILIQHCHDEECFTHHKHPDIGVASAIALAGHSFLDGVGIGLGFQVSPTVGLLVAIAVISHDFTDGMNTVSFMLSHRNSDKKSKLFLLLVAVAPVLGAISTLFFQVPANFLILYLGFFAGFLLYIGASDILPEAHAKYSSYKLIGLTILGTLFIFIITRFL